MIHAVFQCFESFKTSQNTWFTQCFNASDSWKPRKIHDSHRVSTLRRVQKLAKYVIHAMFFEALKTLQKKHDSRRVSMLRRAQKLAKYGRHAMFQRFGGLKTSQIMWFTACSNASKRSKPSKINDSRRVSMLRSARNFANYVIHAMFQSFGGLKQNTWFTPCFNASKRSKPWKIRDSRQVSMLRSAQNLAK